MPDIYKDLYKQLLFEYKRAMSENVQLENESNILIIEHDECHELLNQMGAPSSKTGAYSLAKRLLQYKLGSRQSDKFEQVRG